MSRRGRIGLALGICAAAATAFVLWRGCGGSPDRGWIVGVVAIDDDTAVVTWRANYGDDPSRSWVGRVDGRGRTKWVRPVPDLQYSVGPGSGIIVAGDVVAIRYGHHHDYQATDHAIAAFSLRDGRPLWDVTLAPYQPTKFEGGGTSSPSLPLYQRDLPLDDGRIAVWADDGRGQSLFVLDAATGAVLSRRPSTGTTYATVAVATRVVTHHVDQTKIFDGASDAPPHTLMVRYEGCVIGDEYVALERDDAGGSLIALRGADPAARRVIARPFQPLGASPVRLRRCGRFRDHLVLLVQTSSDDDGMERTYVLITDMEGQLLHTVDLGRDTLWDGPSSVHKRYPQHAPLAGELPRFAPYVQSTYGGDEPGSTRLIMVDLARGEIAWAGPADDALIHMTVFRAGERWYTFWPNSSWILSAFDGSTGELSAAVQLRDYHGIAALEPVHVAGDRVWVAGGTWTAFDAAQIAVLDGATLAPTFARGVEVTNVTAQVRQGLRAP